MTWLRGGEIRRLRTVNLPLKSRLFGVAGALALIALIALLATLLQPEPEVISGRATATDGDSLRLGGERIRLLGIDAPEYDQICGDRNGANWRCGEAARLLLAGQLRGGDTECRTAGRDRYGRLLAHCIAAGNDLGQILVGAGLAIAEDEYLFAEGVARANGSGIWAGRFDLPRDWRQHHGDSQQFDFIGWLRGIFAQLGTMHLTEQPTIGSDSLAGSHEPAGAPYAEIEVTPEMIEAGLKVFRAAAGPDGPRAGDTWVVAEIWAAMSAAAPGRSSSAS